MTNLFKGEWFRHRKITAYKIFVVTLITFSLGINLFLKIISSHQNFPITMLDGFRVSISLYLMGLILAFPLITTAFTNKSKFIQEQLVSSGVTPIQIYLIDIVMGAIISTITFSILQVFTWLFGYIILGPAEVSLNFGKANYNIGVILLAILLTNASLVVQSISLQKIVRNPIISTGVFILISYIISIILIQLRFFSNIAGKLSLLFPICDVNYLVGGYMQPLTFVFFNIMFIFLIS